MDAIVPTYFTPFLPGQVWDKRLIARLFLSGLGVIKRQQVMLPKQIDRLEETRQPLGLRPP